MRIIDEQYLRTPFFGSPQMTRWLREQKGELINHKRVERLMRQMGLVALNPGPHTSRKHPQHKVYPYLLRGLAINHPDQVWASDITYIPMYRGFFYLVVIMDWYSRYVLSWSLSNTLDPGFCLDALDNGFQISIPIIFNSDQGVQYTSDAFVQRLKNKDIAISMAAKGRCFDNILVERFWRSLKYEEVYLNEYTDGKEAYQGISNYLQFHNQEKPHQIHNGKTPEIVYYGMA